MAKILVVTGELSGDWLASGLIRALKELRPDIYFYAVGGNNLRSAGAEIITGIGELSVMGFTEVLFRLKTIRSALKNVSGWIRANRPDIVILVDFPTFNFKIAKLANSMNIPIVYYIPPKIWASRYKRINFIKKYVNLVILIFPFELQMYKNKGIDAYYAGNPLQNITNTITKKDRPVIKSEQKYPVISFLPGSRSAELKHHSLKIIKTIELIRLRYPRAFFIFPFKKGIDKSYLIDKLSKAKLQESCYRITDMTGEAFSESDVIVVASGTASLEAAFYNKPVIIIYSLNYLSYVLAKILVRLKYIGLINILAGRQIVPEFIQKNFKPDNVYNEIVKYLEDEKYKKRVLIEIESVILSLKTKNDPYKTAAAIILEKKFL